jgi:putative ABC transport system permease protein
MIVTFISLLIAILIIYLIQPYFHYLVGYDLKIDLFYDPRILSGITGIYFFVSFFAGSYPALILTKYMPSETLKGSFLKSSKGVWLRKTLVIFQFTISLVLIASTLVVQKQLKYIQQSQLGYDKEHTLVISMGNTELKSKLRTIKNELLNISGVKNITSACQIPVNITVSEGIDLSAVGGSKNQTMSILPIDKDFFNTMNIEFVNGHGFTKYFNDGDITQYVINEAALELLDWSAEEALGREIRARKGRPVTAGPIVGVVKDFHFKSFHEDIAPLVLFQLPRQLELMLVKIDGQNIPATIAGMETRWKELTGGMSMDFHFLDQDFDKLYSSDARIGRLFSSFALIAICIACLGLFGLASFATLQRTKEIGIRKVMGADVSTVLALLIRDMTILMIAAIVIGIPIAHFAMKNWLDKFAYKTTLGPGVFIIAGITILIIYGITISYHTIQAATRNPVDSLRYE